MAAPLHDLTKKDTKFVWTSEAQTAFEMLREALTTPPILTMPRDDGDIILDTDASDRSIGSVLSQIQDGEEKVIAYAGRVLSRREINYCITRKELLAVVYSLKHFRQYLLGKHYKVRTDHAALTWLRRTPEPIGQQARWLEIMEDYDFVEHRPGLRHANADAISRRPCTLKSCVCKQVGVEDVITAGAVCAATLCNSENDADETGFGSIQAIQLAQERDEYIAKILQFLKQSPEKPPWESVTMLSHDVKVLWSFWPRLRIYQGVLQRSFEETDNQAVIWQVILPKSMRKDFWQRRMEE